MADDRIELEIVLDDGKIVKGFGKIADDAKGAGAAAGENFSRGFSIKGGAAAVAIGTVLADAVKGIARSVSGAMGGLFDTALAEAKDAENSLNSLQAAFRAAGLPVQEATSRFADFASALQQVTTVGDDAIISNAGVLVSIGKLRGEGLERATKAALDLSAGLNMELGSAFELVAKAASGNAEILGRYGIRVQKGASDSAQFAEALTKINAAFGGMAESKVNTFSGALLQMQNRFADLLQSIGEMVTKSPVVVALVKALGDQFLKLTGSVDKIKSTGDLFGDMIKKGLALGQTLVTYVIAPLEFIYNIAKTLFWGLTTAMQGMLMVLVALGNGLVKLVMTPMVWVIEKAAKLAGYFNKDLAQSLQGFANDINRIPEASQRAFEATGETFVEFGAKTRESFSSLSDFKFSIAASDIVADLQTAAAEAAPVVAETGRALGRAAGEGIKEGITTVGGGFSAAFSGFKDAMADFSKNSVANFKQVGASMFQALGGGASQAFAAFGKALVSGENALQAFMSSFLSMIGQMAIQLGQSFILQGIAHSLNPLTPGIGGPMIAAGAALAVFGGILSGIGGGAKDSGGGGVASSNGIQNGGIGSDPLTALPETEREKPATQVAVNIQGNVFDKRETGMAIVDILNEHFSASDGRLVTTV